MRCLRRNIMLNGRFVSPLTAWWVMLPGTNKGLIQGTLFAIAYVGLILGFTYGMHVWFPS